jgi:hypothetical protein
MILTERSQNDVIRSLQQTIGLGPQRAPVPLKTDVGRTERHFKSFMWMTRPDLEPAAPDRGQDRFDKSPRVQGLCAPKKTCR